MRRRIRFAPFAVLLVAVGCGGGGGGGGGPALVRITQANAVQVARMVVQGSDFVGADLASIVQALSQILESPSGSIPCLPGGGSLQNSVQDAPPLGELSAGDSATVTFNNCVFDFGGLSFTLRGQVSISLARYNVIQPDGLDAEFSCTFRSLVLEFGGSSVTLNGDAVIEIDTPDGNVQTTIARGSSLSLTAQEPGNQITRRYTNYRHEEISDGLVGTYAVAVRGRVHDGDVGGAVDYETDAAFEGVEPFNPTDGMVTVTGTSSALTIGPVDEAAVRLHVDEDGDGTPDSTIDVMWRDLHFDLSEP